MEDCISDHQFLISENYIVQPVENISCTIINYDKVKTSHLIHAGQLPFGAPVIQLAEIHGNNKPGELHPLEEEIRKDRELKQQQQQQQTLIRCLSSSVIQCSGLSQSEKKLENIVAPYSSNGEETEFRNRRLIKDTIGLGVFFKGMQAETTCCTSLLDKPMKFEKKQLILLSDNAMLLNVNSKENKDLEKNIPCDKKFIDVPASHCFDSKNKVVEKVTLRDSDSENEEIDLKPVCDYEPDPDGTEETKLEENEKPNYCYMCFKSFRHKKNMYAHIRKIHSTQPKIEGGIVCPLCKMHVLRQKHLRAHLSILHSVPIEKEEKLFNTMEEFFNWKELMEKETFSFYISKSSSKLLANNQQKTYYKCHRSGNYDAVKKGNKKKKLELSGSNKVGATCPAAIEATENKNGINVIFWKTHVGHDTDLQHLASKEEKKVKIVDYLASGYSWNTILDVHNEETKPPSLSSKSSLVLRVAGLLYPFGAAQVRKSRAPNDFCCKAIITLRGRQPCPRLFPNYFGENLTLGPSGRPTTGDLREVKQIQEKTLNLESLAKKKGTSSRKWVKESGSRCVSQASILEKAYVLLNLLETTEIKGEFRPKVGLMIDNLISTIKRRSGHKMEEKEWTRRNHRKTIVTGRGKGKKSK